MVPTVQSKVQNAVRESRQKVPPAESRTDNALGINRRRFIKYLSMGSVVALTLVGMYYYAFVQSYESTDDASIEGKITDLAPKIAGRVRQVLVDDNQQVAKGELLVTIDPGDYDAALRQKQAALNSARGQAGAVQASIQQQEAHINTLAVTQEADLATAAADRANAINAAALFKRSQELFARQVVAPQELDLARANRDSCLAIPESSCSRSSSEFGARPWKVVASERLPYLRR
jgi:membrane fusion protein, multidrug efflux system